MGYERICNKCLLCPHRYMTGWFIDCWGGARNGLLNACSLNGRQVSRKSCASILHLPTREGPSMNVKRNERFMKPRTHLYAEIYEYLMELHMFAFYFYWQLNAAISDGFMHLCTWITDSNRTISRFILLIYNKKFSI